MVGFMGLDVFRALPVKLDCVSVAGGFTGLDLAVYASG